MVSLGPCNGDLGTDIDHVELSIETKNLSGLKSIETTISSGVPEEILKRMFCCLDEALS